MSKVSNKYLRIAAIVVSILWVLLVTIDYINKHPGYYLSFKYFQYPKLYAFFFLSIGFLIWHFRFDKFFKKKIPINGLSITILAILYSIAISLSHKDFSFSPTSIGDVFHHVRWVWAVIGILFIMTMTLKSIGQYLNRLTFYKYLESNYLLDLSIGLVLFISVLFMLGVFGVISPNSVITVLFIFALLNLFDLVKSIQNFFLQRIRIDNISSLTIFGFLFCLIYLVLNFQTSIGPYPSGFDSRNFYMNISQLISDNNALVEGFQPYNWSLFMSIGFVLFNKVELAMGISFYGVILVLLASYMLGRKVLKLDSSVIFLCFGVFLVTPAITNQMNVELKIDFGLLFFQIMTLFYAIELLSKLYSPKQETEWKDNVKSVLPLICVIGLLSGFGLGIKMINLFMIFNIVALLWWDSKNRIGTIGILSFVLLFFLLGGIDTISGLNLYHLSVKYVIGILALMVVGSLAYSFLKHSYTTKLRFSITVIYLFVTGLMIVPWMIKNYSETHSLNPQSILFGKSPGPDLNLNQMMLNYEKTAR